MESLPIDADLDTLLGLLRRAGAVVLVAPPGAGKTTRFPPALLPLAAERGAGKVLVLQPRRIAAQAAAHRIAAERGLEVGGEVGYQVRFERRTSPATRLEIVTEGILLRRLQDDPFLEGVGAVVLDEFHERSLAADLCVAWLREIRATVRPDLLLAVMSASLDPAPIARFLGGCPVHVTTGRPYPVAVEYVPRPPREPLAASVHAVLPEAFARTGGHALVFLPGLAEIRRVHRELTPWAGREKALLLPLHGGLALEDQHAAVAASPRRKVILCTNVAETSLTVEGVDLVVDAGQERLLFHDARRGIDQLRTVRISRNSAEQRSGRAGRTRPGLALRLWSAREHAALEEQRAPEIRRVDLAGLVLELRAWSPRDPAEFPLLEPPERAALERAAELLASLGALHEGSGGVTPLGRLLLRLPVHPRLARLLVETRRHGLLREGCTAAALLEERDILFPADLGPDRTTAAVPPGPSDLLWRMDLLEDDAPAGLRVSRTAASAVRRLSRDLERRVRRELPPAGSPVPGAERETVLRKALLTAYPDRVCARRGTTSRGRMVGGKGVALSPRSGVRDAAFFLALELGGVDRQGDVLVHQASAIEREWLREVFPEAVHLEEETSFDARRGKAVCRAAWHYRDLPLEAPRDSEPPPGRVRELLEEALEAAVPQWISENQESAQLRDRMSFLRREAPELDLPELDTARLARRLGELSPGARSLGEVRRHDLAAVLRSLLEPRQVAALESLAPAMLEVPGGRRVRLDYSGSGAPVLAVRIQEMFGCLETPRVARGRVAVLLHLLGPNLRPVQITSDLASFWSTTYPRVRRDLRARYPRHAWPEDPRAARPRRPPRS